MNRDMYKNYDTTEWSPHYVKELQRFLKKHSFKFMLIIDNTMKQFLNLALQHQQELQAKKEAMEQEQEQEQQSMSLTQSSIETTVPPPPSSSSSAPEFTPKKFPTPKPFDIKDFYLKKGDYISYQNRVSSYGFM